MNQPYEAPASEVSSVIDVHDMIRRRKFWKRAIWIAIAFVVVPPMFGLVGTVVGMAGAFDTLAETGQAEPEALAGDISVALLTTMWGLIISVLAFLVLIGVLVRFFSLPKPPTPESNSGPIT